MIWKTISLTRMDDIGRLRSAWGSSMSAFGPNKVFDIQVNEIETNLPVRALRDLFRFADVRFSLGDVVWDSMRLEDRVKEWEKEDGD